MENLRYLCTKNIFNNLDINYILCKKYSWKIPVKIGDYLIEYLFNLQRNIDEIEYRFFNDKIILLSRIYFSNKFLKFNKILNGLDTKFLRIIDFSRCCLDEKTCSDMSNFLQRCCFIENINFSSNRRMDYGFRYICNGLNYYSNKSLKILNFSSCNLNFKQCMDLGDLLRNCSKIEVMDLSMNQFMGYGFINICKGLIESKETLKEINLNSCNLIQIQGNKLAELLSNCSNIEKIRLNHNFELRDEMIAIVQQLIKSSKNLNILQFGNCFWNPESCKNLGELISNCSKISIFTSFGNALLEYNNYNICEGLTKSSSYLREIDFSFSDLNKEKCQHIGILLLNCSYIENIDLSCNNQMFDGFNYICKGLLNSSENLKCINLALCELTVDNLKDLENLLLNCILLEKLNLDRNIQVKFEFSNLYNCLLKLKKNLKFLHLRHCKLNKNHIFELQQLFNNVQFYFN